MHSPASLPHYSASDINEDDIDDEVSNKIWGMPRVKEDMVVEVKYLTTTTNEKKNRLRIGRTEWVALPPFVHVFMYTLISVDLL